MPGSKGKSERLTDLISWDYFANPYRERLLSNIAGKGVRGQGGRRRGKTMGNAHTGQHVHSVLEELRELEQRVASAHSAQRNELEAVTAQLARVQATANVSRSGVGSGSHGEAVQEGNYRLMGACARFGPANVLVGPVIGMVTETSARVMLEVDRDVELECHVCIMDETNPGGREVKRVRQWFNARKPSVFHIASLDPGIRHHVVFSGITKSDALHRTGSFRTMYTHRPLEIATVSGNAFTSATPKEVEVLWGAIWKRIDQGTLDLILHVGGQVDLRDKFSRCALMLEHLNDRKGLDKIPLTEAEVARIEYCVCEELRQVYRDTWNQACVRRVLASASNLMIWSDLEIPPSARRNTKVHSWNDKVYPAKLLVLAQQVFREYQRSLWDASDACDVVRLNAESFSNEETFFAKLTEDSAVLFIDSRSSQFNPDGAATPWPVGPLITQNQWQQITSLLRFNMNLKNLIVATDRPIVPYGLTYENPDDGYDEWCINVKEQSILLNILLSWRSEADIVLVCGPGPFAQTARTIISCETSSRSAIMQLTVSAVAGQCYSYIQRPSGAVTPESGKLTLKKVLRDEPGDAFELEALTSVDYRHGEVRQDLVHDPAFGLVGIHSEKLTAIIVRAEADSQERPSLLLGPVVGQVTHNSAVLLLEASGACSIIARAQDQLTGEIHEVRVPVVRARKACRILFQNLLVPDRHYIIRIEGLDREIRANVHTMPAPENIEIGAENQIAVFSFYRNSLTDQVKSAWLDVCNLRQIISVQTTAVVAVHLGGQVSLEFTKHELEWAVRGIAKSQAPHELPSDIAVKTKEAMEEAVRGVYRFLWTLADLTTVLSSVSNVMCISSLDIAPPSSFACDPDLIPWYETVRHIALDVARDFQVGLRLSTHDDEVLCCFGASLGVLLLSPVTLLSRPVYEQTPDCPKLPAKVWDALDLAVMRDAVSVKVLLAVTDEPIIDNGPLDAHSRSSLDPNVKYSWAYHTDECTRLLDLIFAWQVEKSGRAAGFLCGSEVGCSFRTSICHELVQPRIAVPQYCISPLAGQPRHPFAGKLPFLTSGFADPALLSHDATSIDRARYAYRHKVIGNQPNAFLVGLVGYQGKRTKSVFQARLLDAGILTDLSPSLMDTINAPRNSPKSRRISRRDTQQSEGLDDDHGDDSDEDVDFADEVDSDDEGADDKANLLSRLPPLLQQDPISSWMMGVIVGGEKAKSNRIEEAKLLKKHRDEQDRLHSTEAAIKRDYPDLGFPEAPWETPRESMDQEVKEVDGSTEQTGVFEKNPFRWLDFDVQFYGPLGEQELMQWYRIIEDIDSSATGESLEASFTKYTRENVGVARRKLCKLCRDFFLKTSPEDVQELCFSEVIMGTARGNLVDAAVFTVLRRLYDVEEKSFKAFPYGLIVPFVASTGAVLIMSKALFDKGSL